MIIQTTLAHSLACSAAMVLHTALAGRRLFVVATAADLEREEFTWFVKSESVAAILRESFVRGLAMPRVLCFLAAAGVR